MSKNSLELKDFVKSIISDNGFSQTDKYSRVFFDN